MDRYAGGDDAAFASLYDALSGEMFGFLLRRCRGDHAIAEDLLQQTFLRIHRARRSFSRGAAVFPWAYAIARRVFIDDRRRARLELVVEPSEDELSLAPLVRAEQESMVDAKTIAATLRDVLSEMPEPRRAAFELVRRDGMSTAEAALVLGVSESAVKVRVFRAQEALRRALAVASSGA